MDGPNSRIYSPARMKRRAIISKQHEDNPPNELPVNTPKEPPVNAPKELPVNAPNEKSDFRLSERRSRRRRRQSIIKADSENIRPEYHRRSTYISRTGSGFDEDLKAPSRDKLKTSEMRFLTNGNYQEKFSDTSISSDSASIKYKVDDLGDQTEKNLQKAKILGSLLPDEILRDPISRENRVYNSALLFADVSGFTQLCQKYDKTGKGGPSRLTQVLNGYIGSMIDIVILRHGDVCKFGGDAFLCTWRTTKDLSMTEIVHLAVESAIDIQKNCGEHKTDVGVKLRVKIAVSAGKTLFAVIGKSTKKYYVIAGDPVLQVRDAEHLCKPGDVIVTQSAWKHVENYTLYSFTYQDKHIRVHDFGPLWKSVKRKLNDRAVDSLGTRPFLKSNFHLHVHQIRPFILPTVMKNIDLSRSLDHMTEMRQVAIVFINVVVDFSTVSVENVINLCNRAFQIVSTKVDKAGGGTNKLTLFDKDIAILTVFGFKGFKHELASQVALKCAHTCVEALMKLEVQSASAGVTTGMAYCGVIGHTLRKEYTVMGHPVNLAARLMCAYTNMVSCDRSTFLNSKMESGHFEVLELENLKGIQNAGPFYKFNVNTKSKLKLDSETHPILGRGKEIEEFEAFLKNEDKSPNGVNFFIIFGNARIGKSRLAAKLIDIAQRENMSSKQTKTEGHYNVTNRETHFIPLTEDDCRISYSVTRLIFQPVLGFNDSSSVEEKEDKIVHKLGDSKELSLLASFNQIFNVNFDLTPQYLALTPEQQANAQIAWMKKLYNVCFRKGWKWLIVIDDAEFMDDESWKFLTWCSIESDRVLYVLTIGQKRGLSDVALNCLDVIKAKKITLKEIDKWFYLGLACQILGVQGIPVELENLLQSYKSSGNPGWLESFLLSLLQSGSIYITQTSLANSKNLGLVAPPEFMLTTQVTENKTREDSNWRDYLENFESMSTTKMENIPVCLLGNNFRDGKENDGDLNMDVIFIKTIDTLKPLEQLVLKAGSVLGINLKRAALKFVLSKETTVEDRQLAKATKHLFDMKILMCAKGDLTQRNQLISRRMISGMPNRSENICECVGVKIPESCADLPKYANCGYMQFRFPSCKETLYNLLLDEQKKHFHNGCIEFLRENTYKCKSCNSTRFTNLFGYKEDDQVILVCTTTPMHGVRSTFLDPKRKNRSKSQPQAGRLTSVSVISTHSTNSRISDSDGDIITLTDTGECQCSLILASVYSVLLEHAAGCGRRDIMLELQLESAAVNLTMYNIPFTMQILEDALALVNQMKEDKEYPEFCTPFIYSKIYTLMGATKLAMGRLDESLELLKTGLKYMKKRFPYTKLGVKCSALTHFTQLKLKTQYFPRKLVGRTPRKKVHFTDLLSECLGLISIVYMYMENRLLAENASLWSLNKALDSNSNLYVVCSAYTNLMEVCFYENDLDTCAKLELHAIEMCRSFSVVKIELFELEAIGKLFKIIFQTRHVRAEIEEAIHIGFQSVKIATVIHSTNLKLSLIPDLIFALIQMNRLSEAVTLLQELDFISRLDSDQSGRLWYYAICLDFQLYTGFTVVPYEICENFVKSEEDFALVRDPYAKHRLYTSLWLWCTRNSEWELIKSYGNILKNSEKMATRETLSSVFTRLERLEGLLINLVHKMDSKNVQSMNAIFNEAHALIHKLKKDTKVVKVFKPRYILLKSYYRQIRYRDNSFSRFLNTAHAQAEKMNDRNAAQWILHLKMVWNNAISPIDRDQWIDHCRTNIIEWHESDELSKKPIVLYSLPLPKF